MMIKKHFGILKLNLLVLLFSTSSMMAQTNRALLVAISDYPIESGWDETHATNDCNLVIPMLKTNGYKQSNITTLLNEQATKMNIVKALKHLAEKATAGDYIYIHFSGHGQQMADDNGDEEDGLDEAFIPYDALYRYKPGVYEGENHLRDDELEKYISAIRRRIGETGNIIVVLDACHSGTGTRAKDEDEYVRGTSYIFAPPDYKFSSSNIETVQFNLQKEKDMSSLAVYSACLPDEANYEYKANNSKMYYGRLTYFFCFLADNELVSLSNHSFYIRLKEQMNNSFEKKNRKQTPYFESTDRESLFRIGKSSRNDKKTN